MGWTNWIVIPDWKVMVEVSRQCTNDHYQSGVAVGLERLKHLDDRGDDLSLPFQTPVVKLTAPDYGVLTDLADAGSRIMGFDDGDMLIGFLEARGIKYHIHEGGGDYPFSAEEIGYLKVCLND